MKWEEVRREKLTFHFEKDAVVIYLRVPPLLRCCDLVVLVVGREMFREENNWYGVQHHQTSYDNTTQPPASNKLWVIGQQSRI